MNPLEIILDDIAALRAERGPSFRWATVTNVEPLRVRLDGDEHELPIEPGSVAAAAVDDRVLCLIDERRITVIGNGSNPAGGEHRVEHIADANDAVEPGVDYVLFAGSNMPADTPAGVINAHQIGFGGTTLLQVFWGVDASEYGFYRQGVGSRGDPDTWSDWVQFAGPGLTPNNMVIVTDWNDADKPGFYYGASGAANRPPDGTIHQGLVLGGSSGEQLSQLLFRGINSDASTVWFRVRFNGGANAGQWGQWRQIAGPGSNPKDSVWLDTSNLNNITEPGFYHQTANASATLARNYPVERAGSLEVLLWRGDGVLQRYTAYPTANGTGLAVYIRTNYNGWGEWQRIYPEAGATAVVAGRDAITPTANTPTSTWVWFGQVGEEIFASPPEVTVSAITTVPGSRLMEMTVSDIDTYGFNAWMYRTNTTRTSFSWIAAGKLK